MLIFPNSVGQSGVFRTGTPNYADFASGSALAGCSLFVTEATAESWADGDVMGVRVEKDSSNYQIWTATWDATGEDVKLDTLEQSIGTIGNGDNINVWATPTANTLRLALAQLERGSYVEDSGLAITLDDSNSGYCIVTTNASAVALTVDDASSVGSQWIVFQYGAGVATVDSEGSDLCNGLATGTGVAVSDQYKSAFVFKFASGKIGVDA